MTLLQKVALRAALRLLAQSLPPLQLSFRKLASFERPQLVFYAAPDESDRLFQLHVLLHELVDPELCGDHYRPQNWVPHCTLAPQVSAINRDAAKALAERAFNPFDVEFDTIEVSSSIRFASSRNIV
jgi:2'-5' RNA ligase